MELSSINSDHHDLKNNEDDGKKKAKEVNLQEIDIFSRALVTIRSSSYQFLKKHKSATNYFVTVVFNGLLLAYLVGAIYYYVEDGKLFFFFYLKGKLTLNFIS